MKSPQYKRDIYCVTPPREPDEKSSISNEPDNPNLSLDPKSIHNMITLLKARLQYAQLKIATGMSTENLQKIEQAFLSSPRQPRIPLPQEYPPMSSHNKSRDSKKIKRLLFSATTPKKKKHTQENQLEEEAARTILMLSQETPILTPPRSEKRCIGLRSPDINRDRFHLPPPPHHHHYKKNTTSLYDAVSNIPNYEKKSKRIGKSLPRKKKNSSPPLAVVSHRNQDTGSPHQTYQYNRPLPSPPKYSREKLYQHSLPEDPFYSRPIISDYSRSKSSGSKE